MGEEEDRYLQFMAARAKSPPLTLGNTLHWDGTGAVSQDVELTQGSEPVACPVFRSTDIWRLDLLPAPPAPAIDRAMAAALTFYLDAGLLLASVHTVIPGATGQLLWVSSQKRIESPPSLVHPALLVHTVYESLQVEYTELVLHLPIYDPLYRHIALVLQAEREAEGGAGHLYAQSLADALVVHFLRRYAAAQSSLREVTGGLTPFKLRRTLAYIQEHLEHELSLATLATVAQTSPSHFARLFKQATGRTPHQYVLWCRMEQAKRLLVETDVPLIEIAYQIGCTDQSHFTALFRQHVATTPKAYRDVTHRA
jgi:AraC family transcriptional regulator